MAECIAMSRQRTAEKEASSETAQDINRSIILNSIRTSQLISRADLAGQTGLQGSTISLIVDRFLEVEVTDARRTMASIQDNRKIAASRPRAARSYC
jgi:hypothetical protein